MEKKCLVSKFINNLIFEPLYGIVVKGGDLLDGKCLKLCQCY